MIDFKIIITVQLFHTLCMCVNGIFFRVIYYLNLFVGVLSMMIMVVDLDGLGDFSTLLVVTGIIARLLSSGLYKFLRFIDFDCEAHIECFTGIKYMALLIAIGRINRMRECRVPEGRLLLD